MRKFELTEYGKKYCTGKFFVNYWDGFKTVTKLMTMEETLNYLVNVGFPFGICAELKDGGKTFAKLLTTPWDEEIQDYHYVIAQLQGSHIVKEV